MDHPRHAAALEQAVSTFERRLVGYALRLLQDREEACDAAQETLLKLCRVPPEEFEKVIFPKLEAWLFTVCRNACLDRLRRRGRERPAGDGMHEADAGGRRPEDEAELREEGARAQALLATLSERQREVVILKFHANLSYAEIAEVMDMTVNNVGVTLHLALKSLRRKMEEHRSP